MLDFLIFAVTFLLVLIGIVIYLYPGSKKVTTIPGPDPVDTLEGNLPDITSSGSMHEFLQDLHETYGSIVAFWLGPQLAVSLADPELFQQQSNVFDRPDELYRVYEPLISTDSIKFCGGGEGRKIHAACAKPLKAEACSKYYKTIQKLSDEFVEKWRTLTKDEHVPLKEYMMAFAMRTILKVTFGPYFDDGREVLKMKQSFDVVWSELEIQLTSSVAEATSRSDELFEQHKKRIQNVLKKAVDYRKNNAPQAGEELVIDALMKQHAGSEARLAADMMTVLAEGFNTTGLFLTWAVYFLASHSDEQEKVYKEIVKSFGKNVNMTAESQSDLKHLKQFLDETLRCSVLVPYAARVQNFDIELGGHKIPNGTPIVHALGVVMQNDKFWSQPEKFDPNRFSPENRKNIPDLAFQPFGFAGKRKCLGADLAMAIATTCIAAVVQSFKVDMVPGQVVTSEHALVSRPKEEIWVTLSQREK